jgi:hypothetical protein
MPSNNLEVQTPNDLSWNTSHLHLGRAILEYKVGQQFDFIAILYSFSRNTVG